MTYASESGIDLPEEEILFEDEFLDGLAAELDRMAEELSQLSEELDEQVVIEDESFEVFDDWSDDWIEDMDDSEEPEEQPMEEGQLASGELPEAAGTDLREDAEGIAGDPAETDLDEGNPAETDSSGWDLDELVAAESDVDDTDEEEPETGYEQTQELSAEADFSWKELNGTYASITEYTGTDTEVVIPGRVGEYIVQKIGNEVFKKSQIISVTIPSSVEIIDSSAFENSRQLETVIFGDGSEPSKLQTIGSYAFKNCAALEKITLPSGLKKVGYEAFCGTGLTEVMLPDSVVTD